MKIRTNSSKASALLREIFCRIKRISTQTGKIAKAQRIILAAPACGKNFSSSCFANSKLFLRIENKRLIFIVKKRNDQHQNAERDENDGFGNRVQIGDVV